MTKEDYSKYYIQNSDHYLLPKDVFDELFNEMSNWKEENQELKIKLKMQLKYKAEILQEDKPIIEEIEIARNDITYDDGAIDNDGLVDNFIDVKDKLNEVIDYINRKEINDKN